MDLTQNPIYQLNVMIALSQPAPEQGPVNPVLYHAGFELEALSRRLPLPPHILQAARQRQIDINKSAAPDLLLRKRDGSRYLIMECKAQSFSADSSDTKQCKVLLLFEGKLLKHVIAARCSFTSTVVYVVGSGKEDLQRSTLRTLAAELQEHGFNTSEFDAWALVLRPDALYLRGNISMDGESTLEEYRVLDAEGGAEPWPLLRIPYDPNTTNDHPVPKQAFLERIHTAFTSQLAQLGRRSVNLTIDDILRQVYPLWDLWEDKKAKKHLRQQIRRKFNRLLEKISKEIKLDVRREGNTFSISRLGGDDAKRLIKFLSRTAHRTDEFRLVLEPQKHEEPMQLTLPLDLDELA